MPHISSQDFNKANAGEEQPCCSVQSWRLQIQNRGIKNSLEFFFPLYNHLQLSTCFSSIATEPSWFNFIRLLLPPPESPKPLFILGAGRALRPASPPHLLSSDIKVSQFTPPSLILPLSLPPMFCSFPCILLSYPVAVVFVSRFTFALEVPARRQRPPWQHFPLDCLQL